MRKLHLRRHADALALGGVGVDGLADGQGNLANHVARMGASHAGDDTGVERCDYWGLGVGLALWDAAREGLQEEGCLNVSVWVPVGIERTIRFHELAGFKREWPPSKPCPWAR